MDKHLLHQYGGNTTTCPPSSSSFFPHLGALRTQKGHRHRLYFNHLALCKPRLRNRQSGVTFCNLFSVIRSILFGKIGHYRSFVWCDILRGRRAGG